MSTEDLRLFWWVLRWIILVWVGRGMENVGNPGFRQRLHLHELYWIKIQTIIDSPFITGSGLHTCLPMFVLQLQCLKQLEEKMTAIKNKMS